MAQSRVLSIAVAVLVVLHLTSATGEAQARTSLTSARVAYGTLKTRTNPQGDLKDQLAVLESELAAAMKLGRTGEARRLIAKGMLLLAGREWTDLTDFAQSLVLRTDRLFVDPSRPLMVRIEQIYSPRLTLTTSLTARASLHKPRAQRAPAPRGAPATEHVADLGTFDGVSRDLLDEPFPMDLTVSGYADGVYTLQVELLDDRQSLGTTRLDVEILGGLDQRMNQLESGLRKVKGLDALHADVRYPIDFVRKVNRGIVQRGTFIVGEELQRAEAILASLQKGKDPFAGRTGDFERHYTLDGANEIMPYRVYVPSMYNGKRQAPLIIALHGLGATEDSMFDYYERRLPPLAESHGYLVAAPLGFRVDGFYGTGLAAPPDDPAQRRRLGLSEKDVLEVLERMRERYNVDPGRIYLMGHSMGAIGTWRLAAKYPDLWAALGPIAGTGDPRTITKMGSIPQVVVHGDADATVPVSGSRNMVAEMTRLGVPHQYIEVPGGTHTDVVVPNLGAIFDFFDKHRKVSLATPQ